MKRTTILIGIMLFATTFLAQNRGGRGGNNRSNEWVISQQNVNTANDNGYFSFNNSTTNQSVNYNNIQVSNVAVNTNKVQQKTNNNNSRNVNSNFNMANTDVYQSNDFDNRGGNIDRGGNINVVEMNTPVFRGNGAINPIDLPVVEQTRNVAEPVQQKIVMDNVDAQIDINVKSINIQTPDIALNFSLDIGNDKSTSKEKEVKDKTPVDRSEVTPPSLNLPKIDLDINKSKSSTASKSRKFKRQKGFGYQQHVTLLAKIASKTAGIKKLLKKKKPNKIVCSVVCYQF